MLITFIYYSSQSNSLLFFPIHLNQFKRDRNITLKSELKKNQLTTFQSSSSNRSVYPNFSCIRLIYTKSSKWHQFNYERLNSEIKPNLSNHHNLLIISFFISNLINEPNLMMAHLSAPDFLTLIAIIILIPDTGYSNYLFEIEIDNSLLDSKSYSFTKNSLVSKSRSKSLQSLNLIKDFLSFCFF